MWLAKHLRLGSEVAVKFLNRDVSLQPTARERFVREARTIAKIRSPHVVQVHDFGFHDEHAYLVMEYLVGETLEARLERAGALTVDQVARVCTQIAKALQKAHDAGLIHRDIKPANVFLVDYGDEEIAKVVDFGIVKSTGASLTTSTVQTLTQTGSLLGTPYYMSPEQIQDSGNVGHQADLWALGVIAYESLLGRLPFTGANFARLVMAICRDPIPVPSSIAPVPPAFDDWIARALERDPAKRFQSAKELARELCQALIFGSGTVSMPDGVLSADLLWSGAYAASALGASRPGRSSDADSPRGASSDSDRPSEPGGDTIRISSEPPVAAIPGAVLNSAIVRANASKPINPSSSQDGSLSSHVAAAEASVPPRRSIPSRAVLIGVGAAALLATGWLASRLTLSHDSAPAKASASDVLPSAELSSASSSTPPPAASPAASAVPSASVPPATAAVVPPSHDVPPRATHTQPPAASSSGSGSAAPVRPVASTPSPADKNVDPLEERQ